MKKLLALLLALTMAFSLAACGTTAESTAAEPSQAEETTQLPETQPEAPAAPEAVDSAAEPASDVEEAAEPDENAALTSVLADAEPVELPVADTDHVYEVWMAAPGNISSVDDLANQNETYAELQERTRRKDQVPYGQLLYPDGRFQSDGGLQQPA